LEAGVQRLAQEVSQYYGTRPLTIIGVLTGSLVLLADLIRQLQMPLRVGVVQASSYNGTSRGDLTINSDLMPDIQGRDVLLIDDILDSGHTLQRVIELTWQLGPNSVRSAVLLRKRACQAVALEPDFVCFEIPDEFVVGYGLDYQDAYRNLAYVAALEPEDLEPEDRRGAGA
jgi:hypoxanthine phosphoribosyltransferase